ncbi:hypothetical protein Cabys_3322 [Caldithrix abyssi DSM 13497]|uniref:Uncharacterized protein n=1 Tax=Caldithrix abyssi DSM 13497 TaxID=880073 RepID=A0A1J1CC02_CALAY|nr:hypothetical protein Cabys_3322 [Caldithrix abyssi DSM 13497]
MQFLRNFKKADELLKNKNFYCYFSKSENIGRPTFFFNTL